MKKNLFHFLLLSAMVLTGGALVGCGEDVQELADNSNNGETVTETTTGANRTLFTGGGEDTRTSMDTDRKFYWSTGDQIYVNTEGTTYKRTSESTPTADFRRADFVLEGVKLTAPNCSVVYIGNGTTAATAEASELKVKIEDKQRQSAWGNSDHLGASGDCGVAVAIRNETTGKYSFDLTHKAAYLIFQPYKDAQITATWKVLKIEIIADGTTLAGEYDFGTGALTSPTGTSNTVELNCNSTVGIPSTSAPHPVGTGGFVLGSSASAANSCFAVIQPGNHKLTIRYTVQPEVSVNDVAGGTITIDKEIPAANADGTRTYNPNGVTTIKHELGVMLFNAQYYQWDAQNPYNSPTGADYNTIGYPANVSELATHCAQYSCKDLPNVNELYWYIENGDPHWDTTTGWSIDGSGEKVYTGGLWLKKKQTILDEGKDFRDDIGKDGVDMRLVNKNHTVAPSQAVLPAAERSKYFFLPALGTRNSSSLVNWRAIGTYWLSSPYPGDSSRAHNLGFNNSTVGIGNGSRYSGFVVAPGWFR